MLISFWIGPKILKKLKEKNVGEEIRTDGPKEHALKVGTPTMGGVIVLLSIIIPTLLWADLKNTYILLILISTYGWGLLVSPTIT